MAIDLDAAKAARREQNGTNPQLTYGGKTWDLPLELPLDTVIAISELEQAIEGETGNSAAEKFRLVAESLLGDNSAEFLAFKPSVQDIGVLIGGLVEEYGLTPGESEASQAS